MTSDFDKGFTVANLKGMRQFYLVFPNGYALRSELSWTHYRILMRVVNESQIFASKYKLYLPIEEELVKEISNEYIALESIKGVL